jgi:hypothetical protein
VNGLLPDDSGLSRAEKRAALLEMQGGRCAICGSECPQCADHDHATGLLRGMLCSGCNRREGQHSSTLLAVDDLPVAAYLACPPAAPLGWMWDLPVWWTAADTGEARALEVTATEYAASRYLDHLTNDRAVAALAAVDLPELDA